MFYEMINPHLTVSNYVVSHPLKNPKQHLEGPFFDCSSCSSFYFGEGFKPHHLGCIWEAPVLV